MYTYTSGIGVTKQDALVPMSERRGEDRERKGCVDRYAPGGLVSGDGLLVDLPSRAQVLAADRLAGRRAAGARRARREDHRVRRSITRFAHATNATPGSDLSSR
jgi:hypothetical protein